LRPVLAPLGRGLGAAGGFLRKLPLIRGIVDEVLVWIGKLSRYVDDLFRVESRGAGQAAQAGERVAAETVQAGEKAVVRTADDIAPGALRAGERRAAPSARDLALKGEQLFEAELAGFGPEIVAADPLRNTIIGWQAYWGSSQFYQRRYGMSLTQGIQAAAQATFPIQIGIDRITDPPSETMDFGAAMSTAQSNGVGWLWWDWYNPYGPDNNLSRDGSANLLPVGQTVVNTHPASIRNTSVRPCRAR